MTVFCKNTPESAGNAANHTLASSGFNECHDAEFYSNRNHSVYQQGDSNRPLGFTRPLSAIPAHVNFLEPYDQWLVDLRKVLLLCRCCISCS